MIFSDCILSLDFFALSSSIQSGWNQWSRGMSPNSAFDDTIVDNRLWWEQWGFTDGVYVSEQNSLFEFFRKVYLVEENIWVMVHVVIPIFDLSNWANGIPQLIVSAENHESSIGAFFRVYLVIWKCSSHKSTLVWQEFRCYVGDGCNTAIFFVSKAC